MRIVIALAALASFGGWMAMRDRAPDCPGMFVAGVTAGDDRLCVSGPLLGCFAEGSHENACHDGQPAADWRRPLRVSAAGEVTVHLQGDGAVSLTGSLRGRDGEPVSGPLRVRGGGGRWTITLPRKPPGGEVALGVSAALREPAGAIHALLIALDLRKR